ncbi:cytochrome P450 family protein [Mycobacterium sp.]|uniref:cytochrome P450 family protein n=1 Tax=Mycobacterium sp. TaxID=1785 RepID=UPI003BACD6C0
MIDFEINHPIVVGSAEFNANQHRYYDWMRREAPVYRGRLALMGDQDVYFVSRYRDCLNMVTDPRIRRVVPGAEPLPLPESLRLLTSGMIYQDDPEHMRLRKLVSRSFTPRAIALLGDRVETVTRELLDAMEPGQHVDLQQEYALPVPATVINEIVGVAEQDRSTFHDYIELLFDGVATYGLEGAAERMDGFVDYLRGLIDQRRADPAEDILTGLIHASEDDDSLSEGEVIAMIFLLIAAGYETTFNLITNGVAALLTHPEQFALLKQQPELIDSAVEEMLRYTGTVGGTEATTFAAEDITLHDVTIPQGAMVMALLASANRDPAEFDKPDSFDITRDPNNHLAFSKGNHFCLGAHLARMETQIAIANLIERFPNLTLAVAAEELSLQPVPLLNRLRGLPVIMG